jgi:DNA-directed RNA polymerase subunit RPC12/RpoP
MAKLRSSPNQKPKFSKPPEVRCPACGGLFSVPAKEIVFDATIACPHCHVRLIVTFGRSGYAPVKRA